MQIDNQNNIQRVNREVIHQMLNEIEYRLKKAENELVYNRQSIQY